MRSRRLTCCSFVRLGGCEKAFSTLGNIPRKPIDSEIGLIKREYSPSVRKSGDIAISCTHLRHLCGCIGFVKHVKHNPSKERRKLEKVLERCTNDGTVKQNAGIKKVGIHDINGDTSKEQRPLSGAPYHKIGRE